MMNWIKIPDRENARAFLPQDGSQFLAIWKGAPGICQYDDELELFCLSLFPSEYEVMAVALERERKFTHWMPLPPLPED